MLVLGIVIAVLAYGVLCFYGGMKYGNKLEAKSLAELQTLRNSAAAAIKGKG